MVLLKNILVLLIVSTVLLLGACNQQTDNDSYAIIVVVDKKEYNGSETVIDDSIKIEEMIGEVEMKTPAEVMPENNQSNFFEDGTKIYSVKDTDQFIIVKDKNNVEHFLERAPGDK